MRNGDWTKKTSKNGIIQFEFGGNHCHWWADLERGADLERKESGLRVVGSLSYFVFGPALMWWQDRSFTEDRSKFSETN